MRSMGKGLVAAALAAAALATTGCLGFDFFGANNVEPSVGGNTSAEAEGKDLGQLSEMFTREASGGPFRGGTFRATMLDYAILKARVVQRANREWWDPALLRSEVRKLDAESLAFEAYISGPSQPHGWGKHWRFVLVDSHRRRRLPATIEGVETPPGWGQDKDVRVYYNYVTLRFPDYQVYENTRFVKLIGLSPARDRYELVWNFVR